MRYWGPRRLIYNAALVLALGVFMLAALANVAYCAVYSPDLFVQFSGLDAAWRRRRVLLLIIGTAFAATITHFVAPGLFQ